MIYDLIIIGAGPTGLALAHCCSFIDNLKILVIDKEKQIGGCHRVSRIDYKNEQLFTEHGPRVYSSTYQNFKTLLNDMDTSFKELFTLYNFQIDKIGKETILSTLNFSELFHIVSNFVKLIFNNNHGSNISMKMFMENNNYSLKSIDMIDRICRLTDGGDINKYTLNLFLQMINQQSLYSLYQPKYPNDLGLFKIWRTFLEKRNVTFILETNIIKLNYKNNIITSCIIKTNTHNKVLYGKTFILAIPPKSLVELFLNLNDNIIKNSFCSFKSLQEWTNNTKYINYISISFHFDKILKLSKVYGFTKSEWGIVFIVLSDYIKLCESNSKTIISIAITITDRKSKNNNKTANECNKNELIKEVYLQLLNSFPNLPKPSVSILSPNNYYKNNEWLSTDSAFILSPNENYISFESNIFSNLYNLGTHNGYSKYKFTTMESAISNSIKLSHILYPKLKSKYNIKSSYTLIYIIKIVILIIVLCYLYKYIQ